MMSTDGSSGKGGRIVTEPEVVTHDVFGGEHPQDIYVHSIDAKEKSWGRWNRVEGMKE